MLPKNTPRARQNRLKDTWPNIPFKWPILDNICHRRSQQMPRGICSDHRLQILEAQLPPRPQLKTTKVGGGPTIPWMPTSSSRQGDASHVRIVSHPTTWGSLTATAFLPKVGHPRDSVSLLGFVLLWQRRENIKGGASTSHPPTKRHSQSCRHKCRSPAKMKSW